MSEFQMHYPRFNLWIYGMIKFGILGFAIVEILVYSVDDKEINIL